MDMTSSSFDVRVMLKDLLTGCFGPYSRIAVDDFCDDGSDLSNLNWQENYLYDRVRRLAPINAKTQERLNDLFEVALSSHNETRRDAVATAAVQCMQLYSGCDELTWLLADAAFLSDGGSGRADQRDRHVRVLLGKTFQWCKNVERLGSRQLRDIYEAHLSEQVLGRSRVLRTSEVVGLSYVHGDHDALDYPSLISHAGNRIELLHLHGLTWITNNENHLLSALVRHPDLRVQVVLLDPHSVFVPPYGTFIGANENLLRQRIELSINTWKTLFSNAIEEGHDASLLQLRCGDWFPSKSLSRFDDIMLVEPKRSCFERAHEPVFEYRRGTDHSAFASYEAEFEYIRDASCVVPWERTGI